MIKCNYSNKVDINLFRIIVLIQFSMFVNFSILLLYIFLDDDDEFLVAPER